MKIFEPVVIGLVTSILMTAISGVYFHIKRSKKQSIKMLIAESINYYFKDINVESKEKLDIVDKTVEGFRERIAVRLAKRHINKSMLFDLNNMLNHHLHGVRIKFIKHLVRKHPEITEDVAFIFIDNKVSHAEILAIINQIEDDKSISDSKKKKLIEKIRYHCVENNELVTNSDFLNSLGLARHFFFLEYLSTALFIIPIIGLLGFGWFQTDEYLNKKNAVQKSFTFGAVGFVSKEKWEEVTNKIAYYLSEETGINIQMKEYGYDDVNDTLANDVERGNIDGFILNPGSYAHLIVNNEAFEKTLKVCEMFGYHTEKGKHNYRSVIITRKENFKRFCKKTGKPLSFFTPIKNLSDSAKLLIREYLLEGEIAFTHRNSMSGCKLPHTYLGKEFKLFRESDELFGSIKIKYSGSHTESLRMVKDKEIHTATIYDGYLSKNDTDIIQLYSTVDIPYNSYWYKTDSDEQTIEALKEAFRDMKNDSVVLTNSLGIDSWPSHTKEQYAKDMKDCMSIVIDTFPKPKLILDFSNKDIWQVNVPNFIKEELKRFGYWNILDSTTFNPFEVIYKVTLEYKESNQKVTFFSKKNRKTLKKYRAELEVDNIDNSITDIANKIAEILVPKETIYRDQNGCFIMLDKGRSNCFFNLLDSKGKKLFQINESKIEREQERVTLHLDSAEQELYAYKNVELVYRVE